MKGATVDGMSEGSHLTAQPSHYGQIPVAGSQLRIRAHLVDALPWVFALLLLLVSWVMRSVNSSASTLIATIVAWAGVPLIISHTVLSVVWVATRGQSVGMRVVGIRWVSTTSGIPIPSANLAKLGFEAAVAVVSLGMGFVLVCMLTQDHLGRTWFDRRCGTVTVQLPAEEFPVAPRRADYSPIATAPPIGDSPPPAAMKRYNLHVMPPQERHDSVIHDVFPGEDHSSPDEAEWVVGTQASDMDLGGLSRSLVDSRSCTGLPLSDDTSLSPSERTIGMRPEGSIRLLFDDGTRYDLVDTVLIGRDPVSGGRFAGAAVLAIEDSGRSVSKVHLAVSVRDGQVLVEDLYSTNGTSRSVDGSDPQRLPPGVAHIASPGSLIRFGNRTVLIAG